MSDAMQDFSEWQRLSPWAVLYFIARNLKSLLDPNMVVFLAPLYGIYQSFENPVYFYLLLALLAPLLLIASALLNYWFFLFRVSDNKFQVRKGAIFKSKIDIPFYRIQDVQIEKPFYFKPVGLVSAAVDSAGSGDKEITLAAITTDSASYLREWILSHDKSIPTDNIDASELSESTDRNQDFRRTLLTRSLKDLIIHGLSNNKVLILLAAASPLIERLLRENWQDSWIQQLATLNSEASQGYVFYLAIIALVISVILIMAILSVAGSIILLHNYQISGTDDALRKESGLFNRHQVNLKVRRLQSITIKQSLLDRLFSRYNLFFNQISTITEQNNQSGRFLVPSIDREQVEYLCKHVYNQPAISFIDQTLKLKAISKRYIRQQFLLATLPITTICTVFIWLNYHDTNMVLYAVPTLLILGFSLNLLRWKRWGYCQTGGFMLVRKGLFGCEYSLFPCFKAQQTSLLQSFFMEANNHCHVEAVIGTKPVRIPYITLVEGQTLLDNTLYHAESTRKSWM